MTIMLTAQADGKQRYIVHAEKTTYYTYERNDVMYGRGVRKWRVGSKRTIGKRKVGMSEGGGGA